MRPANVICLALALCVLPAAMTPAAEIYRWKDASGAWHFGDQPVPGAERVSSIKTPAPRAAPATPSGTGTQAAPPGSIGVGGPPPRVSPQVAKEVRAQASEARAEQCKKARVAYELAIQSRRIYRVDAKGEREYLNEADADAARLNARAEMDSVCGGN